MLRSLAKLYKDAFSGLPRTVWILCWAGLINRAGTMVMPFLTIYLSTQRGFSITQAAWILMAFGMGSVFGSYLGGKLCNSWGEINIIIGSLVSSGVGFILLAYVRTFEAHMIGFFILSATADAFRPAIMTAISHAAPENTAKSMALLRLAINLGMAVGPAIGGLLATINYNFLFWADGLTCLSAGTFLYYFRHLFHTDHSPKTTKYGEKTAQSPIYDIPFLFFLVILMGLAFVFFQLLGAYPVYLKNVFSFRESEIGLILALNALTIVLFEMILIHKTKSMEPMILFGIGAFLIGLGFGLTPLCHFLPPLAWLRILCLVFLTLIWTTGEMLALPLANTLVAIRSRRGSTGTYMAWYMTTYAVAFMLAPTAGLFVMQKFGSDTVWWISLVIGTTISMGALRLRPWFNDKK